MQVFACVSLLYRYNKNMASRLIDRFWHKTLRRPYHLHRAIDEGSGDPVVLLHGIGRTGNTWEHVVELLAPKHRIVAFDLLGFGASPQPDWIDYDTDDHVKAVVASIERLGQKPVTLVGHSMGCLIAVRLAKVRPDLVKHLVLYEMPLYEGLPNKKMYRLRTDLYYRLYRRILKFEPTSDVERVKVAQRLAKRIAGFEVDERTWHPFMKSLEHTIMAQTTAKDMKQIRIPIDVIYGRFDMLVIRGKPQKFFGEDSGHITTHTIRESHVISAKASRFIVERIAAFHASDTV